MATQQDINNLKEAMLAAAGIDSTNSSEFMVNTINSYVSLAIALLDNISTIPACGFAKVIMPTNANYTLNYTELDTGNLVITSAVALTTTRNIAAPLTAGNRYMVNNSTTGGQSITFGGTTGTTITIANGTTKTVFTDGVDYFG